MQKISFIIFIAFLVSCSKTRDLAIYTPEEDWEVSFLDTIEITPEEEIVEEPKYYNPSAKREMDLIDTKLDLSFDWKDRAVIGKATLTITPVFYTQEYLALDAKGFTINSIKDSKGIELDYEYDDSELVILLEEALNRLDTTKVIIDYIAIPEKSNGSAAITSDKGLFFINPMGEIPGKPTQIWTQGETENNSKWFPTFDKPNERCSQDISITVENKYQTISNGVMVSSTMNGDGTRTDRWVQKKAHAPYLFMLAVGDFGRQSEQWNGKPIDYYVDKDYELFAKEIFNHTPEMLSFFSELLDFEYPWDKYSQIIVKDFVSGAMENTSAVIFGDFVQNDPRSLIDNGNDYIVAHEMFHHWFGDLVTCESWANLTLNEGFANYSEYLWAEHKYGREKAEDHRMSEMMAYFYSTQGDKTHPLIHYYYDDKEQMFDAHSYNKGGLVLHMLRNMIGDEAFFTALNKYLTDNAFTAVEVDELRMAFEDTIGEDLNWFFDQWYLSEGHPIIAFDYDYSPELSLTTINLNQIQDPKSHLGTFILPMAMHVIYENGDTEIYDIVINERETAIQINTESRPIAIIPDGEGDLLIDLRHDFTQEEYLAIFKHAENYADRIKALMRLNHENVTEEIVDSALSEEHYTFRREAIENIKPDLVAKYLPKLLSIAENDPHSQVRGAAIEKLPIEFDKNLEPVLEKIIINDKSYTPIQAAMDKLAQLDLNRAINIATQLSDVRDSKLLVTMARLFAENPKGNHVDFYIDRSKYVNFFNSTSYYGNLSKYLDKSQPETVIDVYNRLTPIYFQKSDVLTRLQIINLFNKDLYPGDTEIEFARQAFFKVLKEKETNTFLLSKIK